MIKNGFSIVSINESLPFLPESFEKGIKFLADGRGLSHQFINPVTGNKEAAASALYDGIIEMAQTLKVAAY